MTDSKAAVMTDKSQRAGSLIHNSYGKSRVRLTKINRHGDRHDIKELCVDVQLEGEFENTYISGDNASVVATDSMKNTVYVLAAKNQLEDIETFAKTLACHFIDTYSHVRLATVTVAEELWQRIQRDGKAHPHAFFGAGGEKRVTEVEATKGLCLIISGIDDLRVVKTTESAFMGYIKDGYTTLPEAKDRIFGTTISARWSYLGDDNKFTDCYNLIREVILQVFAGHKSDSVQQTLHEMGQTVLERCPCIKDITLAMPNQHRIPFDLRPFGLENKNEVFVATDEPYGLITGTLARKEAD